MSDVAFDATAVPLEVIAGGCGGAQEVVEYWMRTLKLDPVEDWSGRRSLRPADARAVVTAFRAEQARHDDVWSRYRTFLSTRKERRREEREAEAARVQTQLAEAQTARQLEMAERSRHRLRAKYAAEAERAAARRDPTLEEFLASAEGRS